MKTPTSASSPTKGHSPLPCLLSETEVRRFQEHFSVYETALQVHESIPFAFYTAAMWENAREALLGASRFDIAEVDRIEGQLVFTKVDPRDTERVLHFTKSEKAVDFHFRFSERVQGHPHNVVNVVIDGISVCRAAIGSQEAHRRLTEILLRNSPEAAALGRAKYFCHGNGWGMDVRLNADRAVLEFTVEDGRKFTTSREGDSFVGSDWQRYAGLIPKQHVGCKSAFRSLPG
jgi:hypothetical protein